MNIKIRCSGIWDGACNNTDIYLFYILYTIVAGVPAGPIRKRFDDAAITELMRLEWWNWDEEKIRRNIEHIQHGKIEMLK